MPYQQNPNSESAAVQLLLTRFKPTPVCVSDHLSGAVLVLPPVLPRLIHVLQSNPKIPRLPTDLLPEQTADERLLKPAKKK